MLGIESLVLELNDVDWVNINSKLSHWASPPDLEPEITGRGSWSCLSKRELYLYRRKQPDPPSPELAKAWNKYVKLHASCATGYKNWRREGSREECRYLIYVENSQGLGNRILSLVSAFAYALITDRVLLIDSRKTLSLLLCEPFTASSWLLPRDFPYQVIESGPPLGTAVDKGFENVSLVHLRLDHVQSSGDMRFFCDEHQEPLDKVKMVAWSSNQYYVTSFFSVPRLWKKLLPLFPEGRGLDVFGDLARLILSPSDDVWRQISSFYTSYLSCSTAILGVQIRPHGRPDINSFDPVVNQMVQDCLMGQEMLPGVGSGINKTRSSSVSGHKRISVLVASLQGKYYESLRELYLNGTAEVAVGLHSLSHEGFEQHSLRQDQLALAEMWLLSFAQNLVTSSYSTFGYVAHGLADLRPLYLDFSISSSKPCIFSSSSQPCTHYPQAPSCSSSKNLSDVHLKWLQRHVQHCADHSSGVKLFKGGV